MKRRKFFLIIDVIAILSVVSIGIGCNKDTLSQFEQNFFTIDGSKYLDGSLPEGSSEIASVNLNQYVLAGGSSILTVYSDEVISKLYVGVANQTGYLSVTPTLTSSGDTYIYNVILLLSQDISSSFSVKMTALLASGLITEVWTRSVEYMPAGTGALQISLSFDTSKDLDLYVVQPDDEVIYYGNETTGDVAEGCGLDIDSNADCDIDNINNENIFYTESCVQAGKYEVWVNLYANCDITVPTSWVVTAIYNGKMISTSYGDNPETGTFPAAKANNEIDDELTGATKVMEFTISSGSLTAKVDKSIKTDHLNKGELKSLRMGL